MNINILQIQLLFTYSQNRINSNISKINDLPQQGQDLLKNLSRIEPLMRTFGVQNLQLSKASSKYIGFDNIFDGFGNDDIIISLSKNITFKSIQNIAGCDSGKYMSDFKCLSWYKNAQKSESISINPITFQLGSTNKYFSLILCQKMIKYNQTLDSDFMHSAFCMSIKLESLNGYFQNYAKSTVQSYLIEPISQTVIYDSAKPFDKYNQKTLSDLELNYLESKSEAQFFNQTLKQTFKSQLYQKSLNISVNQSASLGESIIEFEYNRNGTNNHIIINPIYLIDKLPQFIGLKNSQPNGYNINNLFAQISILSNEFLEKNTDELNQFFIKYYLIFSIIIAVIAIFSLFGAIIYSLRIKNLFDRAIDHLIQILKKIQLEQQNIDLHYILVNNSEQIDSIFLSKETRDLYQSFQAVFQFLLYSSENFFNDNETETLLKLNRNIQFFKKFKNHQAVGITHNNIGSILLNQGHYFQAIEHFQYAITYARYEIQNFITQNPLSSSAQLISEYSFEEMYSKNEQKQNRISLQIESVHQNNNNSKSENFKLKSLTKNEICTNFFLSDNELKKPIFQQEINDIQNTSNVEKTSNKQDDILNSKQSLSADYKQNNKIKENGTKSTPSLEQKIRNQLPYQYILQTQIDDFPEERIELMSNLYHRQQNLIITLLAFQENQDEQQTKNINQLYSNYFNFWKEIKDILKKQIILCQFLPFGNNKIASQLSIVSKCYFNLNNMQKAENTLNFTEYLLKNLEGRHLDMNLYDNMNQRTTNYSSPNKEIKSQQSPKLDYLRQQSKHLKSKQNSIQYAIPDLRLSNSQLSSANKINTPQQNQLDNSYNITNENFSFKEKHHSKQFEKNKKSNSIFKQNKYQKAQSFQNNQDVQQTLCITQEYVELQTDSRRSDNQNKSEAINESLFNKNSKNPLLFSFNMKDSKNINKLSSQNKQIIQMINNSTQIEKDDKQSENQIQLQKSKSIQNSQKFLSNQREAQSQAGDKKQNVQSTMFEIREQLIYFIKAQYLVKKQSYLDAALSLTSLFEISRIFMSHYPYKITYQLKRIFEICDIKLKEFEDFYQKFNSNISMNIVMIYSYKNFNENDEQQQQFIQLFKDLVCVILTSQKDKIGIMIYNSEEDRLIQYLKLIKIKQIYDMLDQISQDIEQSLIEQAFDISVDYEQNKHKFYSFENKVKRKINENETSKKSGQDKNFADYSFNRFQENNNSISQNQSMITDFVNDENNIQNSFSQQAIITEYVTNNHYHEQYDFLLEDTINTPSSGYRFIKSKNQPHEQNENFVAQVKVNQNMGDDINQIMDRESLIHSQSIMSDIQKQNDIFYESIRQVLNNYFIDNIMFRNSLMKNYFKSNISIPKLNEINQSFNFLNLLKISDEFKEEQQKYIVFITNQITIHNDNTFQSMCNILYYLNIQLIILSHSKGNNFLESNSDSGFEYQQKIIIKMFYDCSKLLDYLKVQRESFTKNIYPTFIQHY